MLRLGILVEEHIKRELRGIGYAKRDHYGQLHLDDVAEEETVDLDGSEEKDDDDDGNLGNDNENHEEM